MKHVTCTNSRIPTPLTHRYRASTASTMPSGKPKYLVNVCDNDLFEACVMVLADKNTTSAEAVLALNGLEELVHQIDFGVRLGEGEGLVAVMRWLDDEDGNARSWAAMVIGAAVQVRCTHIVPS